MTAAGSTILAVTSSTGVMSAAVGRLATDGDGPISILADSTFETDRRHAEEIGPLIQKLLADAGLSIRDLDLLAVDRGPGRFTGLRVGLATVKTLAFALHIPVVGLTSLQILSAAPGVVDHPAYRRQADETVTAVIDARRNEVFQQIFRAGRAFGPPAVGPADALAAEASGLVVGDGLDRYVDVYRSAPSQRPKPSTRIPVEGIAVDAATMLVLAVDGELLPGSAIEPLYLREPDVNPNVKTRPRS